MTNAQEYPKIPYQNKEYLQVVNIKDNEVKMWYEKQNNLAKSYIDDDIYKQVRKQIYKIYPKGGNYFESIEHTENGMFYLEDKNVDGIEEVYQMQMGDRKGKKIFNPRKFLGDKWESYIIDYYKPSWSGEYVAVALKENGESYSELYVVNCSSGNVLPGKITNVDPANAGGLTWGPESKSFLLTHYTQNDKTHPDFHVTNETILYRIKGFPNNLKVAFSPENHEGIGRTENTNARLRSPEDKYTTGILASVEWYTDGFICKTSDLFNEENYPEWQPFFKREDKVQAIGFHSEDFYFISGKEENRSICAVNVGNPNFDNPRVIIPAQENKVLRNASFGDNGLYYTLVQNGVTAELFRFDFDGKISPVTIQNYSPGHIKFTSSSDEGPIYATMYSWTENYDRFLIKGTDATLHPLAYDMKFPMFDDLVFKELEYTSFDGTKIPLSLVYLKDAEITPNTPVFMYSYGAYGLSVSPNFYDTWYSWALNGGIVAFTHIRGGGEKGDGWHNSGKTINKKKSWEDIISAAEYLIDQKMTSRGKIALHTVSGGAVAAGMAVNERPELFGCFVASMGVFNPYDFVSSNFGKTNFREFGRIDIVEEETSLKEMDPFLNVKNQDYPAIYTITGMADERVPFWQTAKYIAKLQEMDSSKNTPVVMRVLKKATHTNFGEISYNRAYSEMLAFCYQYLGVTLD